jgi:hypothetical protein
MIGSDDQEGADRPRCEQTGCGQGDQSDVFQSELSAFLVKQGAGAGHAE